mgnify:CR=1 FL=1
MSDNDGDSNVDTSDQTNATGNEPSKYSWAKYKNTGLGRVGIMMIAFVGGIIIGALGSKVFLRRKVSKKRIWNFFY